VVYSKFQSYFSPIQTSSFHPLPDEHLNFNPILVRFKRTTIAVHPAKSSLYFNPILVRFKPTAQIAPQSARSDFNPILVRFKLWDLIDPGNLEEMHFNPILVRFKLPLIHYPCAIQ